MLGRIFGARYCAANPGVSHATEVSVDRIYLVDPAVEHEDLVAILARLEHADAFLPSFAIAREKLYSLETYVIERTLHDAEFVALFDRNVLSCVLELAGGCEASDQHRDAAAIMAFAQSFDILIEPSLALYEYALPHDSDASMAQLAAFRGADNRHPKEWVAVALARANRLVPDASPPPLLDGPVDFGVPLVRWRRNYIHCLKIASLELAGGSAVKRMHQYLDWAFYDFQIGGAAIGLACIVLAPNAPRRGLLKGIRSSDRSAAISSVRRAAWDLTVVGQYGEAIQQQVDRNRLILLCSFDAGLKRTARAISGDPDEVSAFWQKLWGDKVGAAFLERIDWMHQNLGDLSRKPASGPGSRTVEDLIHEGEAQILSWRAVNDREHR